MPSPVDQTPTVAATGQTDSGKMRRIPFLFLSISFTNAATVSSIAAPLALFATELGLGPAQVGLLRGIMPFFQVLGVAFLPLITYFGCKRVAAGALLARYVFLLMFLLVPLVQSSMNRVFWLLFVAMALFSLCRTISEAAYVPWSQEFIPRAFRGRILGRVALTQLPVALTVSYGITLWLDSQSGVARFYPVFVVAVVFGIIGALALFGLGGGRPRTDSARGVAALRSLSQPFSDRNFLIYLLSSGSQNLVFLVVGLFLLLFFKLRLSIPSGQLVFMAALIPFGGALGGFVSGWFVDRLGSRGVRITAQLLQAALLVGVALLPGEIPGAAVFAAASFMIFGFLVKSSMTAGTVYMLNYVPPDKKESYMSVAYGVEGVIGGTATVSAGFLVAWLTVHPLQLFSATIGPYQTLFMLCAAIVAASALAFACLREDGATGVRDFLNQFYAINSLSVLWGINSYANPTSEERRRELAYRFGGARSVLARAELLEALHDPSFDVRAEAIAALGHLPRSDAVVRALEKMLEYDGLIELQYGALASLGRIGATGSHAAIAAFTDSPKALLRARSIRSLGDIADPRYLGRIRDVLAGDANVDVRLAAVSALGKLRDRDSLGPLLAFYCKLRHVDDAWSDEPRSKVILLAMSKILGCEQAFAHEWRREENIPGYRLARMVSQIAETSRRLEPSDQTTHAALTRGARELADGQAAPAFAALQSLAPLIAAQGHGDGPFVLNLLAASQTLARPHRALLVLICIALRPVLKSRPKLTPK